MNHHFRAATGIRGRMMRERRITPFYQGLVGLFELSSTHPYRELVMLLVGLPCPVALVAGDSA